MGHLEMCRPRTNAMANIHVHDASPMIVNPNKIM